MNNTILPTDASYESTPEQFRLGLVSVSFRKQTPKEILEAMKPTGLSCIEWGSDVHAPCHDIERLRQICELQKEYGIECSSYGTYFRLGETPTEELESYIRAAKILQTNILRLWCGTKSGAYYTSEEKEALFKKCQQAAEIAARNGVVLCMECHGGTFTERIEDTRELMQTVDSPNFRMYWQPFQWKTFEENLGYLNSVTDIIEYIHVFNWDKEHRYPLGEGIDVWKSYLSAVSVPRTLLLEFMPDDCLSTLPNEVNALRKIIGE